MVSMKKLADRQFENISKSDRKNLGINKTNFRKEFAEELTYIRKKKKFI